MAEIHQTTLTPNKLELLTNWLPTQPWYEGTGRPSLVKAGGFRLDDPAGEVGIEFMIVTDGSGAEPVTYFTPMTYRGAPLEGTDASLIGTSEHGVLGTRWVYDGLGDPVLVAQLLALLTGDAEPQMQGISFTPDPSVIARLDAGIELNSMNAAPLAADRDGNVLSASGASVRIPRVLRAGSSTGIGQVEAGWQLVGGTDVRGMVAEVHAASVA